MAQRRGQDPDLRPSVVADPATVRVTFEYLVCATFWLTLDPLIVRRGSPIRRSASLFQDLRLTTRFAWRSLR